jgi:hypothetical protein
MTGIPLTRGQCAEKSLLALDGLRLEKFKMNLPTGLDFYPKPTRGISQSTRLL